VQDIPATLAGLMSGAAGLHEQRNLVTNPVGDDIRIPGRDFMFGVFLAQIIDKDAGRLDADGAMGGPANLATFPFTLGMNDPTQPGFNAKVFNIFDAWEVYAVNNHHNDCEQDAKAAIYRGQEVFNFNQFVISGVPGFTDLSGTETPVTGTCSTCHNTTAWRPARFDHSGITGNCVSCHDGGRATGKDARHMPTSNMCEACHTPAGWSPGRSGWRPGAPSSGFARPTS